MARTRRTIAFCGFLATLVATSPAAMAEQRGTDSSPTGGSVSGPGPEVPPSIQEQSDAKEAVARAYVAEKYGTGAPLDYSTALTSYRTAFPGATEARMTADVQSTVVNAAVTTTATSLKLNVAHYGQVKNFYCGPAVGKMILKYMNEGVSALTGESQIQENIANASHMRTDINGKTAWDSGLFRTGLNKWRVGSAIGYYADDDAPPPSEFENHVVYDTDHGFPVAANTVEFAGGVHYNGHPSSQQIGHWIVAEGYYTSGDGTYFVDPSTTVWAAPNEKFSYATASFTTRFLQTNGVTW